MSKPTFSLQMLITPTITVVQNEELRVRRCYKSQTKISLCCLRQSGHRMKRDLLATLQNCKSFFDTTERQKLIIYFSGPRGHRDVVFSQSILQGESSSAPWSFTCLNLICYFAVSNAVSLTPQPDATQKILKVVSDNLNVHNVYIELIINDRRNLIFNVKGVIICTEPNSCSRLQHCNYFLPPQSCKGLYVQIQKPFENISLCPMTFVTGDKTDMSHD